jgi:hypothetical protein
MGGVSLTAMSDVDERTLVFFFSLHTTLPLYALYVSYSCALAGILAQKHIKSLVRRSFEIIYSGNINVSYSDICNSILEAIEEEKAGC